MSARRAGFTFIEMLVVLVVFGILASIAMPRYRNYKEKAYLTVLRSDLGNLRIAEEAFWAEHMRYSTALPALDFKPTSNVNLTVRAPNPVTGYAAVARHASLPNKFCQVIVGRAADGAQSGEIKCNGTSTGLGTPGPLASP
jgi:prepilin-type N-terminal cleavage/methylation domain-containing protein